MMEIDGLRTLVARHAASTNILVALGMALGGSVSSTKLDGDVGARAEAVLDELGVSDIVARSGAPELLPVLASIRADLLFGGKVLSDDLAAGGWKHPEPALLQAFGDVSSGFPALLKFQFAPALADLGARLAAPGATFLDIGIGVGALSVAMLRQWPELRVVGIEPWSAALALAEANARKAGVSARVELRRGSGEDRSPAPISRSSS